MAPLSKALNFAGAVRVDVNEFRTLDENFGSERPLVNGDFEAWKLWRRIARARGKTATCGARASGWAPRPRVNGLSRSTTLLPPLRGSERPATGRSLKSFAIRDGCPIGPVGDGISFRRGVVRTVRRQLAYPRPVGRNLFADTSGGEKVGRHPTCQSGVLPTLRPPNP